MRYKVEWDAKTTIVDARSPEQAKNYVRWLLTPSIRVAHATPEDVAHVQSFGGMIHDATDFHVKKGGR